MFPNLPPLLLNRTPVVFKILLAPRRRNGRTARDQIFPFQIRRIKQRRDIRLPRLDPPARRRVSDLRSVILIRQPREVMPEFMYENIRRPLTVGCDGRTQIEYPASSVGLSVYQNLDEFIRRKGGNIAQRTIVGSQNVALSIESVICGSQRRAMMNSARRT